MENLKKQKIETKKCKTTKKSVKGITLIALVITIIVLLILAGVSIATLTGDNGILTKAKEAKEETEITAEEEKGILTEYEDFIDQYEEIDWNKAMSNAKAPESQQEERNKGVIGIGTDGKPVNMDLWEYSLLDNGTYGLNTKENLQTDASAGVKAGYLGDFTDDGRIMGKIPQYISNDSGKNFIKVTDLKWLFFNCTELIIAPRIPETVTDLEYTFRRCSNLVTVPDITYGVVDMRATFMECTSLESTPNLPDSVVNLIFTFSNCTNLKNVKNLSNNVEDMAHTFEECYNLTTVPAIPKSVINMERTFKECSRLNGILEINANLTGAWYDGRDGVSRLDYTSTFENAVTEEECRLKLIGTCPMLNAIVESANNPNITL